MVEQPWDFYRGDRFCLLLYSSIRKQYKESGGRGNFGATMGGLVGSRRGGPTHGGLTTTIQSQ